MFGWFKKRRQARPEVSIGSPSASTSTAEGGPSPTAEGGASPTTTSPAAVTPPPVPEIPHEKIMARAYEIWIRKGRPQGQDLENWIEAEAELRAELAVRPDGESLPRKPR